MSLPDFSALGLNETVVQALQRKKITRPTPMQFRLLDRVVEDYADVVVEAKRHEGRTTGLLVFAAHCALNSDFPDNRCVVLLAEPDRVEVLAEKARELAVPNCTLRSCLSCKGNQPKIGDGADIYLVTPDVLQNTSAADCGCIVSLLVENVAVFEPQALCRSMRKVIQASPSVNICLCTELPPSKVDCSVRSMLRRTNRRFSFREPSKPDYAFLLCQDQFDRADLNARVTQLAGLGRVLVLTHNKEVRDLKSHLHQEFGFRTYSIQRITSPADRERVLSDFLNCRNAVLVAMDAFTGVDLIDVDVVIQYYPPQKSMPEEEWRDFAAHLNTTNDPDRPALVCTLVGIDDLALCSHFQQRVGVNEPIMNVSPFHKRFAEILRAPRAVATEKIVGTGASSPFVQDKEREERERREREKADREKRDREEREGRERSERDRSEKSEKRQNPRDKRRKEDIPLPRSRQD